jgi:hypothetical protein
LHRPKNRPLTQLAEGPILPVKGKKTKISGLTKHKKNWKSKKSPIPARRDWAFVH